MLLADVANSQPYLVGNSSDGCHIDLEWHSSLACGSGHITGRNCLVKDLMTGAFSVVVQKNFRSFLSVFKSQ